MTPERLMILSKRWFTLLRRLCPADFRDEMGTAVVEAYMDRARDAMKTGGLTRLGMLWARALADSLRNGPAERVRPAASWRRGGNWGRDVELVSRRLVRAPVFAATTIGTLALGLGMFAVVYTATQRILIDPMPYKDPGDLSRRRCRHPSAENEGTAHSRDKKVHGRVTRGSRRSSRSVQLCSSRVATALPPGGAASAPLS
jgi:hypothetical protein